MTDTISSYSMSSNKRRRTIHKPTKVTKSRGSIVFDETPQKLGTSRAKSSKNGYAKLAPSHLMDHGIKHYKREPFWEDFDTLATEKSEDDVQTAITRMSMASEYKLNPPKMMPEMMNKVGKKTKHRKSSTRRFTSSPLKGRQFNYKPQEEKDEYQIKEVEVIYEEVSSVSNIQQTKASHLNNAKVNQDFESPIRNKRNSRNTKNDMYGKPNDEYLVQMDRSFGHDVMAASNLKPQRVGSNRNTIQIENKDDNTLDLSPIHKTNDSFTERSFEVNDHQTNTFRESHIDKPVELEKINSAYKRPRRKYKYYNPNTDQISPEKKKGKTKKNKTRYPKTHRTKQKRPSTTFEAKYALDQFNDLKQYENFYDSSESKINAEQHEVSAEYREQSLDYQLDQKYFIPETKEEQLLGIRTLYDRKMSKPIPHHEQSSIKSSLGVDKSMTSSRSTVRRYGKNKYRTSTMTYSENTESEGTPTSSIFSSKMYHSQSAMRPKITNVETVPQRVEPIMQSVDRYANKKTNKITKTKVYDYKIDEGAASELAEARTFRDQNYDRYDLRVDSFRPEAKATPQRAGTNFSVLASSVGNSTFRKTVRFAESAEGLLRAVPVDPTFNDSDFIYDMKHIID